MCSLATSLYSHDLLVTSLIKVLLQYHIVGIYHESFKFANFANFKAFAKIKAST